MTARARRDHRRGGCRVRRIPSPAWIYLFFVVVFAAYFFPRRAAFVYLGACVVANALALAYDDRATGGTAVAQLVIASAGFVAIGGAIMAGKQLLATFRARAERLAAGQGALRRVATAMVAGEPEEEIYELVAREAAALLGAGAASIIRFDGDSEATVLGSWADHEGSYPYGSVISVLAGESPADRLGYAAGIVSPVRFDGRSWGALTVTAAASAPLTEADQEQLQQFADLLATAIASTDQRAKLAAQAAADALTGLVNRRTLYQRLAAEVARSVRHEHTLSVAVIDIDHFKEVNDFGGHDAGDEVLAAVAQCLAENARAEDVLGRVGGDEFAWVMPETTREQALVAVERTRRLIAATVTRPFRITVSAGICDTRATTGPAELVSFADGALYWSKAHGRNRCWIYDPEVISELSAPERVERMESSQALLGLRALARAIDAKDPSTRQHSDRVAALAVKLARAAGWPPDRAALLGDAALVHDVGKLAIPDELLHKLAALTPVGTRASEGARGAGRPAHRGSARPRAGVLDPDPS